MNRLRLLASSIVLVAVASSCASSNSATSATAAPTMTETISPTKDTTPPTQETEPPQDSTSTHKSGDEILIPVDPAAAAANQAETLAVYLTKTFTMNRYNDPAAEAATVSACLQAAVPDVTAADFKSNGMRPAVLRSSLSCMPKLMEGALGAGLPPQVLTSEQRACFSTQYRTWLTTQDDATMLKSFLYQPTPATRLGVSTAGSACQLGAEVLASLVR